jgi:hypothetical protein
MCEVGITYESSVPEETTAMTLRRIEVCRSFKGGIIAVKVVAL